jgi:cobyrinic acid a,c-diamide synthase
MGGRLTLGYREAVAVSATPWLAAGAAVRGHEFHYGGVEPVAPGAPCAWQLSARTFERAEGLVSGGVQASFLHVHWAAYPELARSFAGAASAATQGAAA